MQDSQNAHASASHDAVYTVQIIRVAWQRIVIRCADDGRSNYGRVEIASVLSNNQLRHRFGICVRVRIKLDDSSRHRLKVIELLRLEILDEFNHEVGIDVSLVN